MDCPSTSVCTAPSVDYDFNPKKTKPLRRASARRNVRPEVCPAPAPEKDSGWVCPFQDQPAAPVARLATRMRTWAKKNETHPATARDCRHVGPAPAAIDPAQQPKKLARHRSLQPLPPQTRT